MVKFFFTFKKAMGTQKIFKKMKFKIYFSNLIDAKDSKKMFPHFLFLDLEFKNKYQAQNNT